MFINVQRKDKEIARVELPDGGDDMWTAVERHWPQAYDYIDENMIIPGEVSHWDETFYLPCPEMDADGRLCMWILGGGCVVEDTRMDGRGDVFRIFCDGITNARLQASIRWDHLTLRERSERRIAAYTYRMRDGQVELLDILWDSNELDLDEIPREDWAKVFSEGKFDAWGEGRDMSHPVQPGTLDGRRFEVEYEFEPDKDIPHDADDEFWLSHVASIRWVME